MMARLNGRHAVQQNLGALRSHASIAAHDNKDINEETFFNDLSAKWLDGVKYELGLIFGVEKATELLDMLYGKTRVT